MPIEHVADTALWIASHRATESARPDALFHDPLAAILAGERGREIARTMPAARITEWVMAIRTVAIDRLVHEALSLGVDTVLNLGAGLDTRPYRMALPARLRWIEADFPSMIEYKAERLRDRQPVCQLERVAIDLTDTEARRALLARVGREGKCALVLTEGVLPYLANADVARLADDIHREPNLRYWIQDYYQGGLQRSRPRGWARHLRAAPMRFKVEDWFEFFAAYGWQVREKLPMMAEAKRVERKFPMVFPQALVMMLKFAFMSREKRRQMLYGIGYAMLERTA